MSEEKFSKCGGDEKKCKCRISGVRKKKETGRKVPGKKIFLGKKKVKEFAKFAFTSWAPC